MYKDTHADNRVGSERSLEQEQGGAGGTCPSTEISSIINVQA